MTPTDTRYVHGAAKLGRRIATIRAATGLGPLTTDISRLLLKRTLARFDAQIDPAGDAWRPLAISTLARRKRLGFGPTPILHRTGALRGAIHVIRGLAVGAVYTNTGAGSRIGVDAPDEVAKAAAHQRGLGIPARRFLGISQLDVKSVDSLLRRKARQLTTTLETAL